MSFSPTPCVAAGLDQMLEMRDAHGHDYEEEHRHRHERREGVRDPPHRHAPGRAHEIMNGGEERPRQPEAQEHPEFWSQAAYARVGSELTSRLKVTAPMMIMRPKIARTPAATESGATRSLSP